jgi:nitroreductase
MGGEGMTQIEVEAPPTGSAGVPHRIFLNPWCDERPLALDEVRDLMDGTAVRPTDLAHSTDAQELWWRHNWIRAYAFMQAIQSGGRRPDPELLATPAQLRHSGNLDAVFARRSCRYFKKIAVEERAVAPAITAARAFLNELPYLTLYLAVERVATFEQGVYRLDPDRGFEMVRRPLDRRLLLAVAQGQNWAVTGGGGAFFIGVDWLKLRERFGERPEGYMELLLDLGRFGQALLLELYQSGLAAGMTPAIDEAKANKLAGLDEPGIELLYLVKFGVPREVG